ncbi:MAG: protein translocase subunit SecD [Bacteroidales bacterium]|nr:protein translocase subunit SecD [Bacteroidales bacterium]
MQSKGTLGSLVAGIIAIFLVIVCVFYLSFTVINNRYEKKATQYAMETVGITGDSSNSFDKARQDYLKSIADEKVWLGYTFDEVQKWGLNLGLDLKGGMNVTLQVSMPDILRSMKNADKDEVFEKAIAKTDSITHGGRNDIDYMATFVEQYRANENGRRGNFSVIFKDIIPENTADDKVVEILKEQVTDRVNTSATTVLRQRIDAFGVVSPNIQVLKDKNGQILLELPGVKDQERMLKLVQRAANLEFYETYRNNAGTVTQSLRALTQKQRASNDFNGKGLADYLQLSDPNANPAIVGYADKSVMDTINAMINWPEARRQHILDNDLRLFWGNKPQTEDGTVYALYALRAREGRPALNGSVVTNAYSDFDRQSNGNYVSMRMNSDGAKKWAQVTDNNKGFPIAIVLDDVVYSAPNVQNRIDGGTSQITGNFTVAEAQDLANVLKSGKMDFKIEVVHSMVVGPSLGQQSINAGITSFIVALVVLMIFMVCIYGVIPGMVANLGLVFNLFFTIGILSSFQAVLTLSGIAGIVLALGMAVDANVLIFERTKEELRAGKSVRSAIADGYSNAFSAIFDSNLTSIITGIILLYYGLGPIKGFATTLIIGIACSFFTAVYLTRIVFIVWGKTKAFSNLTFSTPFSRNLFTKSNINFLGQRKKSLIVVVAFIVIVIASFIFRGLNPGIDFSGGRNYIVQCTSQANPAEIQKVLSEKFDGSQVSVINIMGKSQVRISTNYKIDDPAPVQEVDAEINDILFDALHDINGVDLIEGVDKDMFGTSNENYGIVQSQTVGPSMADDMRNSAYIAVVLSLIAMFLYILLRFRNIAFSLGALAAVAFTAFTIIGVYSIGYDFLPFSMEVDQTFIAAVLTIIGYQINDTVVVFDRVRENLQLYPKQDLFTTINKSLNATLGRTIMTSLSTMLVLLCIFILGGDAIRSFVFAMLFGVITGTLSTLFIATPVAYLAGRKKLGSRA